MVPLELLVIGFLDTAWHVPALWGWGLGGKGGLGGGFHY